MSAGTFDAAKYRAKYMAKACVVGAAPPYVRGQLVHVAIGAKGMVGPVEFIGTNNTGEPRVCVKFSPAWRHFAAVGDVRQATGAEAARWIVRQAARAVERIL